MTPTPREPPDRLDRATTVPRRRTRAQMSGLAAAPGRTVPQLAASGRAREATGWRWRKRSWADGREGLQEAPRPGRPSEVTEA